MNFADEARVASIIENILGIDPSLRTRQNGELDPNLRVDFTYDLPPAGLALELTGLYRGGDKAGAQASIRMMKDLSEIAEREALGAWFVTVRHDAEMRVIKDEVLDIIRQMVEHGQTEVWVGHYTADDLEKARAAWGSKGPDEFMRHHERVEKLGIVDISKSIDSRNLVAVVPLSGADITGFIGPLQSAVEDNADKMGEARPRQTNLGVWVDRFDASGDPSETPVPRIPPEIDVLWIVHKWRHEPGLPGVWSATSDDPEWRTYL